MVKILLEDGTRAMTGNLDMGNNDITNVGNITGVDSISMSGDVDLNQNDLFGLKRLYTGGNSQFSVMCGSGSISDFSIRRASSVGTLGTTTHLFLDGYHFFSVQEADSGSSTGALWRSSTNADELSYNDGAVVTIT